MIHYSEFNISEYEWTYCFYRREKRCSNIFNFDIETTSIFVKDNEVIPFDKNKPAEFWEDYKKVGFCYLWQFGIDDTVVYGRYLEDFIFFVNEIIDEIKMKICCYIHNAAFEFQFLRNVLSSEVKVFARTKRRPIYFVDEMIEFRCSYMLTRLSLEKWAIAKKLPVTKATGQLEYTAIRTPLTPLKSEELDYGERDILVMYYGIKQYVDRYGTIWDIPLTQTGEVRRALNKRLANNDRLHKNMLKLVVDDINLFKLLLQCFWGGITHASMQYSRQILVDVDSWDIKSSYPWVMVSELFPSTPFIRVQPDDKFFNNKRYSYLIVVEMNKIKTKFWNTYISISKCSKLRGDLEDNGRLISADYCVLCCTNIDWENIQKSYKIESYEILDFYVSINRPLEKDIIMFVLELFRDKTILDGVTGEESNYAKSKEFINAIFGMMVTRDITDDIVYANEEWSKIPLTEDIFDYKTNKKKRNLRKLNTALQIGTWITAYARNNLWQSVMANDDAMAYNDTDSDKLLCGLYDLSFFEDYNKAVRQKQEELAKTLDIDISYFRPRKLSGKEACLGAYEKEEHYAKFKTLGAKKYIYEDDSGNLHMTVSGVRKAAVSQLKSIDDFTENTEFDIEHANKLILHYNDNQLSDSYITVNRGKPDEYIINYKYGICAQPTTYKLTTTPVYRSNLFEIATLKSQLLEINDIIEELIKNHEKKG